MYKRQEDYTSISSGVSSDEAITVWINQGRDQANALNDLIQSEFTPETGIQVEDVYKRQE